MKLKYLISATHHRDVILFLPAYLNTSIHSLQHHSINVTSTLSNYSLKTMPSKKQNVW